MSDEINRGFDSGYRGDLLGPNSAEGMWSALIGQGVRARGPSEGSLEWLVAPFILAPIFATFYPITTAATIATAFATEAVGNTIGIGRTFFGVALIVIPTVIVCWTVGRMDQKWGLNKQYYLARHVARVVIWALLANSAAMNAGTNPLNQYERKSGFFSAMFSMPNIMVVIVFAGFTHFMLVRSVQFRKYWDKKLKMWFFRKKDFPLAYDPFQKPAAPIIMSNRNPEVPEFMRKYMKPGGDGQPDANRDN